MKINWGTGIAIFYALFMIVMVGMVVKSTYNKVHLVQEDYYNKDLNYETFRKKRQNAEVIPITVDVKTHTNGRALILDLPSGMSDAQGHVVLFRPSDKNLDQKIVMKLDKEGNMKILLSNSLAAGLWTVQLEWESDNIGYYKEEQIVI